MLDQFRKIFALLPPHRQRQLFWLTGGMFAMGFVELGLTGAISLLGVALAAPDSLEKIAPLWKFYQLLPRFGEGIPQSIRMLILVLGLVCIAAAVKNLLTAGMTYWQGIVSQAAGWDIIIRIFDNYLHAPYSWHTQNNPAELNAYLVWRACVAGFLLGVLQFASQLGIMLFLMAGAFVMAPLISLLLFGVTGSVAVLVYRASQAKAREAGDTSTKLGVETAKVTHSALYGIREVQIYCQNDAFNKHFHSYASPSIAASAKQTLYPLMPYWFLESVGMLLLFIAVVLMAYRGDSVAGITGTLTLMAAVSWRFLPALNKIVGGVLLLKVNISPVQTLLASCLETPRQVIRKTSHALEKSLELHGVTFRYPESSADALKDIDLHIPKGGMVGLIGMSGAGKSTLVGILTGLIAPQEGKLFVDGEEVTSTPGYLKIGYVPQAPYIVDASLADNVAFCDWGKTPDEERVRKCCDMAAMDFLEELPLNIHTVLGERGVRLSGGQMQRVAIARALYGDPDILLFDEATSALDGAAEAAIQNTIVSLSKNMTVVVVAHRLSTVKACHTLYWLRDGMVWLNGPMADVLPEYEAFLQEHAKK